MEKNIQIIIILITLISCQSRQEKLIGHWHEYKTNDSEYINCYHITDSTIGVNPLSNGSYNEFRRGLDIEESEIISLANDNYIWTSDFKIIRSKLILNDSIFWIRQTAKKDYFLPDFSAGLLVNINPFESDKPNFDFIPNDSITTIRIFIGKIKNGVLNRNKNLNKKQYYIQLNDKIGQINDIGGFINCGHCNIRKRAYLMHVDRNTPRELLSEIEFEMSKYNISRRQIYYLTMNATDLTSGYNQNF